MAERSRILSHVVSMEVLLFRATQSQYALSLLLPTQETAAASFFNPAQVRPDFPVQITIALFTFHTPKGKTSWLCWSRCLRRRLKD